MVWLSWVVIGTGLGLVMRFMMPGNQSMGLIGTVAMGCIGAVLGGNLGSEYFHISMADMMGMQALTAAALGSLAVLTVYALMSR